MRYKTHMMGGAAAGLCFAAVTHSPIVAAAISSAVAMGFARIPDLDHKDSRITHQHKLIGGVVSTVFGKRKWFHSAIFYTILFLFALAVSQEFRFIVQAAYVGILSHLLLDMPTPDGVMLLYPISKIHFHIPFVRVENGTFGEAVIFCLCLLCCVPSILILGAAI